MGLSVNDVGIIVFVVSISLVSVVRSEDGARIDDMPDKRPNRPARGFGSQVNSLPFPSKFNDDLIDWSKEWGSPSKRDWSSGMSGLGSAGGLNKGQYQNWNDYFQRTYRAFGPSQRSKGLGSYPGFGQDGLQNWRAFFDHYADRRFRK